MITPEEFKKQTKIAEEKYNNLLKENAFKKFVPWETLRKLKVYLHNKGLRIDSSVLCYEDRYSAVLLENFVEEATGKVYLGIAIITPEDTEGSAYGKVDRQIIAIYNQYKAEKGDK